MLQSRRYKRQLRLVLVELESARLVPLLEVIELFLLLLIVRQLLFLLLESLGGFSSRYLLLRQHVDTELLLLA